MLTKLAVGAFWLLVSIDILTLVTLAWLILVILRLRDALRSELQRAWPVADEISREYGEREGQRQFDRELGELLREEWHRDYGAP